jgi:hypothetical protein
MFGLILVLGLLGIIMIIFGVICMIGFPEGGLISLLIGGLLLCGGIALDNKCYPTTYEASSEEVMITDKEDNRLYFKGNHCGSVLVDDEMYAILQEGDQIIIKVTDKYRDGKFQSSTYDLMEETK